MTTNSLVLTLKKLFLVFCLGISLSAIFTWPFITKLNIFYKDSGDYAVLGSLLWYNYQSFKSGLIFDQEKYYRGYQFYPQPSTIAYTDNIIIYSLIFSLFFFLTHNFVFSVNLFIFLNFVLSFIAAFYLINYLVKYQPAAFFGALVCTFNPLTLIHYPDHIFGYYSLSLVFLFAIKLLTKLSWKDALFLGISLLLVSLTSVYLFIFSLLFLPIFFLPFLSIHLYQKDLKYLIFLAKRLVLTFLFLPIIFYSIKPYLEFSKNENITRTIEQTYFFSARILDWLSSAPNNFIYGSLVKSYEKTRAPGTDVQGQFNYREHTLFLNLTPLILFLVGLFYLSKKFKKENLQFKLLITGLSLLLLLSFILTFGAYFMGWNSNQPLFKLPFFYLYQAVFFLKGTRVPTRFQMVFYLPFSVFLSYGVYYLFLKIKKKKIFSVLLGVLFLTLVLENINLVSFGNVSKNIDKLADPTFQKNFSFLSGKRILHLPIHIPELGEWSFYTLNWDVITNSVSLNGVSGSVSLDQLNFLVKLKTTLAEEELKRLAALKTDYIVVHKDLLGKEYNKYTTPWQLYQKGAVYEDEQLLIIDLKKYNFQYQLCDYDKDFQKNIAKAGMKNIQGDFYVLILKNNADCFLPSIYQDKYQQMKFTTFFLTQNDHTAFYRMPVIIGPYEQVILSEPDNNLIID